MLKIYIYYPQAEVVIESIFHPPRSHHVLFNEASSSNPKREEEGHGVDCRFYAAFPLIDAEDMGVEVEQSHGNNAQATHESVVEGSDE